MLRGLVVMSLVGGAFATGLYFHEHGGMPSMTSATKSTPPVRQQSCEDDCEQTAIVANAPEAEMRACKARCKGQKAAPVAHEVPRSITVAPADHRRGLAPPPDRRITRTR